MRDTLYNAYVKCKLDRIVEVFTPAEREKLEKANNDEYSVFKFFLETSIPLLALNIFLLNNDPLSKKIGPEEDHGNYPRYSLSDIFDYLSSITNYGKYRVINQLPGDDEAYSVLEEALFSGGFCSVSSQN